MASRNRSQEPQGSPRGPQDHPQQQEHALDAALVGIRDLVGRPRGVGFLADHHGTMITSHEVVDGLSRLVLHAAGGRRRVVTADAVTALPGLDLALVRTEGLGVDPLPLTTRSRVETGTYVRIAAGCWREARVLGATAVTYTGTDRVHSLDGALELAIGTAGRDALRRGGGAAGGPVLDAGTGAVLGVLGTALRSSHSDVGFAVPLFPTEGPPTEGPLAELLAENAATVPAYGADLNLAGVLELTATSFRQDGPTQLTVTSVGLEDGPSGAPVERVGRVGVGGCGAVGPVERAGMMAELAAFAQGPAGVLDGLPGALAGSVGRVGVGARGGVEPVERGATVAELAAFVEGPAAVLGLVGPPGSGRTTELAALAARRSRSGHPTLWLRGADLGGDDESVADPARRALARAARIVAASRGPLPADLGDTTPERLAHLARSAGRPLLLLLDGPEEMPPRADHRLAEWAGRTALWLRETGVRLVIACRAEYWEGAGAEFAEELLHRGDPAAGHGALPPCVHLGDLTEDEAREARARYAVPDGALSDADARHPLTLRLLSEVRAALPDAPDAGVARVTRDEVFSAYLDLVCLRIAMRLAAENGLRGAAVRRLAAKVAGQVHEAARRCLGPGQGELDREAFDAVFPSGAAPAGLGGGTGWASAALSEGLFVPAGTGYRFAHEELADWIQGMHLDLDQALRALVHRRGTPRGARPLPVPHHRIGPVVQALLFLARRHGTGQPVPRQAMFAPSRRPARSPKPFEQGGPPLAAPAESQRPSSTRASGRPAESTRPQVLGCARTAEGTPMTPLLDGQTSPAGALARRLEELTVALDADPPSWWAARLLSETLLRVPDATPYADVLRLLADRIVARRGQRRAVPGELGPGFWTALPMPDELRFELLRRLVLADGPPCEPGPRHLDAAARLLAADPTAVQPHLVRWFDDERPLPATPHATVATAAQALLYTHRHRALDDLTEVLVQSAHRRGDQLLAVLAEEEPSAVCRAVDRWAHGRWPARRRAAVAFGLCAAPHVRTEADRELLRYAALALLARPADRPLHGGALALLVRDPRTRARHLAPALEHFVAGDPHFPPSVLAGALTTHPEPVLDAFRVRLGRPDAGEILGTLADVTPPGLARRVAPLVRAAVQRRPELAGHVAAYVDRRLDHGPAARAVLLPLVTGLLDGGPEQVRAALAVVLGTPGARASRPLRRELREFLLTHEYDPGVLDALLHAAAQHSGDDLRDLVHRVGVRLVRTPDGATRFDRCLVDLGRHVPGFAARLAGWLTGAPGGWAAVVGPSTRRMIADLAGTRIPA